MHDNKNEVRIVRQEELLGKQFVIYGDFENPLFLAKDIAGWIDYDLSSVHKLVSLVDNDEKVRKYIPTPGGPQSVWFLTEDGLYEVLMQSTKPLAKQFKKNVKKILKSIRKDKFNQTEIINSSPIKERLAVASWLIKTFKLNDSSKLQLAKAIAEPLGLPTPEYTESKDQLLSATELLKRSGSTLSAREFNSKMVEKGFIQILERPSSKGVKRFKSLTDHGLAYGENQVHPGNPKETQPLYYKGQFKSLLDSLGI